MNTRSLLAITFLMLLTLPASADAAISGTVRNSTSAQPAAGDDVILLRFGKGMEEVSRAKTDAQGAFTFNATSGTDQYMVRVVHQGVNYDQTVVGTAPLAIQVFDSVAKIPGLGGSMGIAQVESDGKIVKVTEMYAISNESSPPVTQAGKRNYEIQLPEKAALDFVQARRGTTGMWVNLQPAPVSGQPRLYAIDFPLRPGDTMIKFSYRLPSGRSTSVHLRLPYPIKKFAVMHPPSITFKADRPGIFTNPGLAGGWQVEAALAEPVVGDLAFQVSGIGIASAPSAPARPNPGSPPPQPAVSAPPAVAAAPSAAAGAANTAPSRISSPSAPAEPQRTSWLAALAIAGVLMAGALAFFWRMRKAPAGAATGPGAPPLLEALKEELFQLELERAHGSISADEYAESRQAINHTLERAMGRQAAAGK